MRMREIRYLLLCPVSFHKKTKYSICGKPAEANLRIAVLQYMQNYFSETGIT